MDNSLQNLNTVIKKEADDILHGKGLLDILSSHGTAHISGSYALDLMTWRDLDIYLEAENITEQEFFLLGGKIASSLHPVKMSFRNEILKGTEGLPNGLYWGIYLGDERNGAWKIDVWAINKAECNKLLNFCADIEKKLTPQTAANIMDIKSQCWKDPNYRRSYTSMDIYDAVLMEGVANIQAFKHYLRKKDANSAHGSSALTH
jgi:hypothetical protein